MSRFGQFHEIPDLPERAFCENKYEFTLEGGGKGGSQSSKAEIPAWAEAATKKNLAYAGDLASVGYMPYYGPQIAAFNPTQLAAMQSNIGAAEAFGLVPQGQLTAAQGMPAPTTYAGGFQGYGSGDIYDEAVKELEKRRPGQAGTYNAMFVDPYGDPQARQESGISGLGGMTLTPVSSGGKGVGDAIASGNGFGTSFVNGMLTRAGRAPLQVQQNPNDYVKIGNQYYKIS